MAAVQLHQREILKILRTLDVNKANGPDGILAYLCPRLVSTGKVPRLWKLANELFFTTNCHLSLNFFFYYLKYVELSLYDICHTCRVVSFIKQKSSHENYRESICIDSI